MKTDITELKQLDDFASSFAKQLQPGDVVYFYGDLGSGKTTLIQHVMKHLGYKGRVKSPTYTLYDSYHLERFEVTHMDLYRMASAEELYYLGMEEIFHSQSVVFIEWPEKGQGVLPPANHSIHLELIDEANRQLTLESL